METGERVERLKEYVKAGAWIVLGLAVLYLGLKLAFALFSLLIPVVFVGGAAYLGYRWWQRALAPPPDFDEDDDYGWKDVCRSPSTRTSTSPSTRTRRRRRW